MAIKTFYIKMSKTKANKIRALARKLYGDEQKGINRIVEDAVNFWLLKVRCKNNF